MDQLIDAGAVKNGHFLLASGRHSDLYVEKFDLLRDPSTTSSVLSKMVPEAAKLRPTLIVGPTTGGIILAFEMARQLGIGSAYAERRDDGSNERGFRRGTTFKPGARVVVIDDILTTGGSIRETLAALAQHPVEVVGIVVMVDRSAGKVSFSGIPLLPIVSMDVASWEPSACPLCRESVPLTKPGSTSVQRHAQSSA